MKLEFTGTQQMRRIAMVCVLQMLKMQQAVKPLQRLFESTTREKDSDALSRISSALWLDFLIAAEKVGKNYPTNQKHRMILARIADDGSIRINVPYNPVDPKAVTLELRRDKGVLSIMVEPEEEIRIFGRVVYKISGNPGVLKEPIEIGGETLRLGHWLAAYTCKIMEDVAGYMMYHDEGLEKV